MSLSHRPHSQRTERDETNTSILKNKKLGADAVQLKKNALTQEFKELYRERNVRVAEERSDIPKPKEHKLRQALDGLLGENKRRDNRLNELKLRLNIMRRDDISGIEPSEKSVEQRFNRSVGSDSARKMSRYEPGSESKMKDGKDLVDRFAYVKQTLDNILNRKEDEEEINKMLETKINELLRDQKVLADRIGKKGALYEMMEKRFLNLGNTEFAAKNKLTRTSNKLLSLKKEMEKQKTHEDDYFNMKRTAFKRTLSTVEGLKDTIARNLIYLEEIHLKKDEVDEKLEEVNYEEKQIINKRQASEYILLYIDLLESLENDYLKKKETPKTLIKKQSKGPKLNYDSSPKDKPKSMISSGTEETPRKLSEPSRPGSQTMDLEKKGQNSSDTTRDRDVIITRIAQFYDQHPSGTHALVQTLLKIYHEMLLNEQSLSIRHQDLNIERLERQAEIEELEKALSALQQGFILMEEKDEDAEEASPEHVRETERKVVGKLGQYDYKTVKLGEYLVNLCATGIQDTISKLSKAGCSLVTKSGKRVSGELAGRVKEIEGSLSYPKSDFSVPELQGRARSISKAEDSGRDTSISVRPRTISLSTSSPKESVINLQNLQKPEQTDERKDTSSRSEEAGKILFSQQTISGGGSEEFNKVEQLFRSCVPGASPELVYKWNEKVFESKWMLDYLTKEDVKRVVNKYTYYYGNDISEELLKSVLRDLKNEARLVQRKRTSEAFNMTEELLSIFLKHYQAKKNDLRKRFDTEIRSEVLDDLNQVLAVSEHVEKAHNARYQNLFSEQQTEETDVWRKVEDPHDSESEMELVSLRAKTPEIKNMKTTREAIAELHNHYLKERRGLASSQGRRSNSAPKFKVVVSRTRKESFESSDNEEMDSQKGSRLQVGKNGSVNDEKDMVIDSSMTRKKDSSSARRNSRASTEMAGEVTEEDRDGVKKSLVKRVDHLVPIAKEKKVYPIPQAFYKAQQKQKNVEEFKKKLIKDDEILRKIALLEKRQTGFDKKSKDYDKRRDYVPNFSLLEKFDLNREKKRDQIVQEWWKRQEAGMLDTTNRDRSSTPFLISSSRKDERQSWQLDQHTDSSRNVIVSQKRRSLSKSNVKPWTLPEEPIAHTSRPGTGSQGRRSSGRRSSGLKRDSFDDLENKLFKEAISQNRAAVISEIEKL